MRGAQAQLTGKLVDSLYVEAMLLADETRAYFDQHGRVERDRLDPLGRVGFTCESLKVTTRLMHVIAWLLTHRAQEAGEISVDQARSPSRRLGFAADTEEALFQSLPLNARALIAASRDLYTRVRRLDDEIDNPVPTASPARALLVRLEQAF